MIYTDTEQYEEKACLFPDATGTSSLSYCGLNDSTDHLTAMDTLAGSLEEYLRMEDNLCTMCVNEMARQFGVPPGQRRRWVEDYADGDLAHHATEYR